MYLQPPEILQFELDTVVHTCNLSYSRGGNGEDCGARPAQDRERKLVRSYLKQQAIVVVHGIIPAMREA
jgi:hypothetical protein